ncbi:coiled-coil domain-containing protein 125 [Latimeria chalumnae]|uniref:coiled-coil domain-containing protein 125 n=1 Tax=Latimeria chalumnae TaxID=7897 RepID=UPI0003C10541|nr:PREDICTED: coiled-coil domain-containing protein 125 [Latimeria chalumnae]XP_006004440.1 PREDICTED: coiled-coil domain-containing protein 125 [Latimeria chalumnae]|eukprot:XP_006004439.1 PREDICTED: coiled-coil domain-containing protein 125 [Latimeria chalumnae]
MSEVHIVENGKEELKSEETEDDMASGDLGDGLGRRPGGIYDTEESLNTRVSKSERNSDAKSPSPCPVSRDGLEDEGAFHFSKLSTFHDAFYKTYTLNEVRRRLHSADRPCETYTEELKQRLQEATEEAETLRNELETTQRMLEGKYEALQILQNRAVFEKATTHTKTLLQKAEEKKKVLEKEVNTLQWEIEFNQVRSQNLEQSWKEKYNRINCENAALQERLELRENQIKSLKSENAALNQQNLELLAMLDVKEQNIFQETLSLNKSSFSEVTAFELAVLGACNCNVSGGEPCICAKMAAATRKKLLLITQELEVQRKRKEEAYVMADAFRIAFEQQLKRKNDQTLRLTEVEKLSKKEAIRANWKQLKEEGNQKTLGQKLMGMLISAADCRKLEVLDDPQDILGMLIDLLNDKEEALAHQRKVSYMLARSAEEQERYIKQIEDRRVHEKRSLSGEDSTAQQLSCLQNKESGDSTDAGSCCQNIDTKKRSCPVLSQETLKNAITTLIKKHHFPGAGFCNQSDAAEQLQNADESVLPHERSTHMAEEKLDS